MSWWERERERERELIRSENVMLRRAGGPLLLFSLSLSLSFECAWVRVECVLTIGGGDVRVGH